MCPKCFSCEQCGPQASCSIIHTLVVKIFLFMRKKHQQIFKYCAQIELCSFISATTPEYSRLERALSLSKNILAYVNQAVKDCENRNKLKRLQSKIDRKQMDHPEFKVIIDTCIIHIYLIALLVLTIDILFFKNFDQTFII